MNDSVNSVELNKTPFVINNQVYVLGNPVINTQTLDQLVYILDEIGSQTPVVIINPGATTVPDFDKRLSQLIQNNRRAQPVNSTTYDRYKFKDMSDDELKQVCRDTCSHNPSLDLDYMFELYRGLRERSQMLYVLETLSHERDDLWAAHCANPASAAGSERYAELTYQLIPQAQANYDAVSAKLQALGDNIPQVDAAVATKPEPEPVLSEPEPNVAATSSVSDINNYTPNNDASAAAKPESLNFTRPEASTPVAERHTPYGPWLTAKYLKMPLAAAEQVAKTSYQALYQCQQDVTYEGQTYEAVDPMYLIALGIDVYPNDLPICYTPYRTFCRVGRNDNVAPVNLDYWYPTPKEV